MTLSHKLFQKRCKDCVKCVLSGEKNNSPLRIANHNKVNLKKIYLKIFTTENSAKKDARIPVNALRAVKKF